MRKKTKLITLLLAAVMCLAMAVCAVGCGEGGQSTGGGPGVALNQSSATISVGGSATLTATVTGITDSPTWEIDKPEVATITPLGKICAIKAIAEGTAVVTVKAGEYSATCTITVTPNDTETVQIKQGETAITETSVEMGKSITLTGVASKGSTLTWKSSDEKVATVDNGVVTGVRGGTCDITAQVTPSIKATVKLTVTAPQGSDFYNMVYAAASGAAVSDVQGSVDAEADKFFYWSSKYQWGQQEITVADAYYQDGKVTFDYTCDNDVGYYYGVQIMYKNSKHTVGEYYKLNCKIVVDVDCTVTLNNNIVELKKDVENNLSVYYQYTSGLKTGDQYGVSSFKLIMGVDDGSDEGKGSFVQNAKLTISDVSWEADASRVKLVAPDFTYNAETGVITIDGTQPESVKEYRMAFFKGDVQLNAVTVKSGEKVDTSVLGKGEYTAKLIAVAANTHYIDSDPSTASATITVTEDAQYTLSMKTQVDAVKIPGTWFIWHENWVTMTGKYSTSGVEIQYANNAGTTTCAQIFYKDPAAEDGKLYKYTFDITSQNEGNITINDTVVSLKKGENKNVEVVFRHPAGGASVIILLADKNDTMGQGVDSSIGGSGTITFKLTKTEAVTAVKLATPSFAITDGKVVITDTANAAGVCTYELGLIKSGETEPSTLIAVENGKAVDLSKVLKGTYTAKIRAVGKTEEYLASDWSTATAEITSTTETITVKTGEEHDAYISNKEWIEWHDHMDWNGANVQVTKATLSGNGTLTYEYSIVEGSNRYKAPAQLFWHDPAMVVGKAYKLTVNINSSVACKIQINGNVVELAKGDNAKTVLFKHIEENASWNGKSQGASLRIVFGTDEGEVTGGTFVFSNIVIEDAPEATKLVAPSFTVGDDKVVTVTDTNAAGVAGYSLGFFKSGEDEPTVTVGIADGGTIDMSQVPAGTYTVKIKAIAADLTYADSDWSTVTAEITSSTTEIVIRNGEEHDAYIADKTWIEWHDQNWNGSTVEVTKATFDTTTNTVTYTYAITNGKNIYNAPVQLFWHDPAMVVGKAYKLTVNINSSVACKIQINENVVELAKGDNAKTLLFKHIEEGKSWNDKSIGASLRIVFGTVEAGDVAGGTFVFSNIVIADAPEATRLVAPSFTLADKTITITDTNTAGVGSYVLGFFVGEAAEPAATVTVTNGAEVDMSAVDNGEYTAKIKAIAADLSYADSDWSSAGTTVTVVNTKKKIQNGDEAAAVANAGSWREWHDQDWCGSNVTVSSAYVDNSDNSIHATYSNVNTACWFGIQLFYLPTNIDTTKNYDISFKLNSTAAGDITVCGKVFTIVAGDNTITLTVTPAAGKALISLQAGVTAGIDGSNAAKSVISAATFVITELNIAEEAAKTALTAPTLTVDGNTFTVVPDTATAEYVDKYEIALFKDGKVVQNYMVLTDSLEMTFDPSDVYAEEYAVKVRALAKASSAYKTSEWADSGKTVTGTKEVPVVSGTAINKVENQTAAEQVRDTWSYFFDGTASEFDVEYCNRIGEGVGTGLTIKYAYTGNNWTGFNLLQMMSAGKAPGWQISFKIRSSNAGFITVVSPTAQEFEVPANETVTITRAFEGAMIWLRFGKAGVGPLTGEIEISDLAITEIVKQKLVAPSFEYNAETGVITITDTNEEGVKEYALHFYQGSEDKGNVIVENGKAVEITGIAVGEYTVKLVAVGDGKFYTDSDPSKSSATINVETASTKTNIKLITNDGEDVNNNKEQWLIWNQFTNVTEHTYDSAENKIVITYEYTNPNDKPWFSMRLFYRQLDATKGYFKCTINVQSAGIYMINNNATELKAGDNEIYVKCLGTDFIMVFGKTDTNPGRDAQTVTITGMEFTSTAPPAKE